MPFHVEQFEETATQTLGGAVQEFIRAHPELKLIGLGHSVVKDTDAGATTYKPVTLGLFATAGEEALNAAANPVTFSAPPGLPRDPIDKASATVIGVTKLSTAPLDPDNPIAVGDRDGRMLTQSQKDDLTDGGESTLHTHPAQTVITVPLRNESGSTIVKGRLIAVTGYSGPNSRPTVSLADKDTDSLRPAVAITSADVPNGSNFDGLVLGSLTGLDTSAFSLTDQLVLGDSGALSRPPPDVSPFTGEVQYVASVTRVDASSGEIFVNVIQTLDVTTADQVFALAGTSGTPGPSNKYVTDQDARLKALADTQFSEVTVDTTTTSTSFVDLLTITFTTGGGDILIFFTVGASNSGINNDTFFRLIVDATTKRGAGFRAIAGSAPGGASICIKVTGLAAGSHTFKAQWRVSGGTGQIRPVSNPDSEHASLIVEEVNV